MEPSPPTAAEAFTVARRDEMLAAAQTLPQALRCPPIRSVSDYVLFSLATADGVVKPKVRAWLKKKKNRALLQRLAAAYKSKVAPNWPSPYSIATFNNMVRQTLLGLQPEDAPKVSTTYLVATRLRLLHEARQRAIAALKGTTTAEDAGFRGLCVHDHYVAGRPGPWFQLHLLYRLVLKLEQVGVLAASPHSEADCPICFAKVEGVGHLWHQLEPCRHWICDACADAYMQERDGSACPQCRAEIVLYVRARSDV